MRTIPYDSSADRWIFFKDVARELLLFDAQSGNSTIRINPPADGRDDEP
jgi:hypothetical protein